MKVLHISKYYPPYSGGIEDVCYNIVHGLKEYDQKVLCFNDMKKTEISVIEGIEVRRAGVFCQLAKQPISIKYLHELKYMLRAFKPDIIHLHLPNLLACLYILLLNIRSTKIVLHWHSDIIAQKMLYRFLYPIERVVLKKADRIIVTSPNYLDYSLPLKNFREKCVIIPNMISVDKMSLDWQAKERVNKLLKENKKIVFFVGRHVEYKGIEYLLKAEKHITSDCSIYIAGSGPLTDYLKAQNTSNRIHFIGKISDEEMKVYMNAASVFAFPSITKNEAFGVALAEAMYCKAVPVTFTINGSGVNWVSLNGCTGIKVENKNSKALGEAIDLLLKNDSLRMQYAEEGYKRVLELFTMRTIKNQIIDIYESCS